MVHPCALLTVVVSLSLLLPLIGSASVPVVVAVAVMLPVACGSTVIVTVAEALLARPPMVQVTVTVDAPSQRPRPALTAGGLDLAAWGIVCRCSVRAMPERLLSHVRYGARRSRKRSGHGERGQQARLFIVLCGR
jgi:hypothetical protein